MQSAPDLFIGLGGAIGGIATAIGTGWLVGGSLRKRRLERLALAKNLAATEEDEVKWRLRVSEQLEGRPPTQWVPGFRGVVERVDNLEVETFGGTRAAIEKGRKP